MTFWLATSVDITPEALKVQVWDPLPFGLTGYVADPTPQTGIVAAFQSMADLRTLKVSDSLTVSLVTVRAPTGGWPRCRALAYRIAIDTSGWLPPPGGAEPLPGAPPAAVTHGQAPSAATAGAFSSAWFTLDPLGQQWAGLVLHGGAPATWPNAETFLSRLCRGPAAPLRPNVAGPNVPEGRPSLAILLTAVSAELEPAFQGWTARNWLSGTPSALAKEIAAGLMMISPDLWTALDAAGVARVLPTAPNPDGTRPVAAVDAKALARLGAHLPIYAQRSLPAPTGLNSESAATAFALLFNWGNQGAAAPPARAYTDLTVSDDLTAAGPPQPQVLAIWPGQVNAPGGSGVQTFLTIAGGAPLISVQDSDGQAARPQGPYENLVVLCTAPGAALTTPKNQRDDSRASAAGTGEPARRVYQLAICACASRTPPPVLAKIGTARTWNAQTLSYGDHGGKVPVAVAAPTFGVFSSFVSAPAREPSAKRAGMRMTLYEEADKGVGIALTHQGHRVVPRDRDLALGNRMRLEDVTDGHNLGGIKVLIDGRFIGDTAPDGVVSGALAALAPGGHDLTIDGPIVRDGNPGPATASAQPRLWRRRKLRIVVAGEGSARRIIKVENEPVVSAGVQILIDPVWMKLVSGVAQANNGVRAPSVVSLVVIHRTESADGRRTLTSWQKTPSVRVHDGETPKQSVTAAAYQLARDGTLVKCASDNTLVNHAPGLWGPRTGNPPKAADTQRTGVGIEMSRAHDAPTSYTEAQYAHLIWLLGQYVSIAALNPRNIVGHGDVKDVGKDDPGLEFEWSRLEALGYGFRRALKSEGPANDDPVVSPVPGWPPEIDFSNPDAQDVRRATGAFAATWTDDLQQYPVLFQNQITGKRASDARNAVAAKTRANIETIGYSQTNPKDPEQELLSFRSHIFSGARRLLFALKRAPNSERVIDEDRLGLGFKDGASPLTVEQIHHLTAVYAQLIVNQMGAPGPFTPVATAEPPEPR